MKLRNGQTLLFTGDSITDSGRNRSMLPENSLGDGYVQLVNSHLAAGDLGSMIRVFNTGIGGNRVIDLKGRWQADVLDHQPDWLSVLIGINDVWQQFSNAGRPNQVMPERFVSVYRELLSQTRPDVEGLVLMTPFYLEANRDDPMRARMDLYGGLVKELAQEFDAVFVDLQAHFDAYLACKPTQTLCSDRVHPNQTGHLIIAHAFLEAVGFSWGQA